MSGAKVSKIPLKEIRQVASDVVNAIDFEYTRWRAIRIHYHQAHPSSTDRRKLPSYLGRY